MKPSPQSSHDSGLYSLLQFAEDGQINLDSYRMLLIHTDTMAVLRKELSESLGMERARGLFTRMGYESGKKDAELAKKLKPEASDSELFSIGPQLHELEGIVQVIPNKIEMDPSKGHFYGDIVWKNSYESQVCLEQFGIASDPVCWMQIGYACGYTSTFLGTFVLYKEIQCSGCGHKYCQIIGKSLKDWGEDVEEYRYFKHENVADQLLYLQSQVEKLSQSITPLAGINKVVGESDSLHEVFDLIRTVANSQATVMLMGETGVGKDLFAHVLHDMSNRKDEPFVAINCAAIPEDLIESELFGVEKGAFTGAHKSRPGKFERAHKGTLFLDEVDKLSESAQAKLLRVLQDGEFERVGDVRSRKVDVRIVTASNADLQENVNQGLFRKDLYFRLSIYPVVIPPLRERLEDIPVLAKHFVDKNSLKYGKTNIGFGEDALQALKEYNWPGNIREFENVIERGVILAQSNNDIQLPQLLFTSMGSGEMIDTLSTKSEPGTMESITDEIVEKSSAFPKIDEVEAILLEKAVDRARGNLSAAAKLLGLTRPQLAYRIKKLKK